MVADLKINSKYIIKRNGHCLYSETKLKAPTTKRDFYCSADCLYK